MTEQRPGRILAPEIPPDLTKGSVVLDRDGTAWQRGERHWYQCSSLHRDDSGWTRLLLDRGPLDILYYAVDTLMTP